MSDAVTKLDRRDFVRLLTAGVAGETLVGLEAKQAHAASPDEVNICIVGGGMAGTTCAKYLSFWGNMAGIPMTIWLIERNQRYISNILSNGVLIGERTISSLTYDYNKLLSLSTGTVPIKLVRGEVVSINPSTREIRVMGADGANLSPPPATRIILASGIDFDTTQIVPTGKYADEVLHAWDASLRYTKTDGTTTTQTSALQEQLSLMANGENVAIIIPKVPYRCPPGPYERACVIADWMKTHRSKSKVYILDSNPGIVAEPINFGNAFGLNPQVKGIHAAYVSYNAKVTIQSIDADSVNKQIVYTDAAGATKYLKARVVNLIPSMKASKLITENFAPEALSADKKWARINELTYESIIYQGVHVIGDSISSKQPKAGHIGNQEAKVCADAILRMMAGVSFTRAPMTNSACFTPITTAVGPSGPTATWLTALYRGQPVKDAIDASKNQIYEMAMTSYLIDKNGNKISTPYEPLNGPSGDNFDSMTKWFTALMQDVSFK